MMQHCKNQNAPRMHFDTNYKNKLMKNVKILNGLSSCKLCQLILQGFVLLIMLMSYCCILIIRFCKDGEIVHSIEVKYINDTCCIWQYLSRNSCLNCFMFCACIWDGYIAHKVTFLTGGKWYLVTQHSIVWLYYKYIVIVTVQYLALDVMNAFMHIIQEYML